MFCKYCGKEIDDTATKCPYCDAVIEQPAPQAEPQVEVVSAQPAPQVVPVQEVPVQTAPVQQEVKKTEYVYIPPRKSNTMAIVGFILSFFIPLVGLILSIIGLKQSKANNDESKGLAIGGIVIGALGTVGYFILFLLLVLPFIFALIA